MIYEKIRFWVVKNGLIHTSRFAILQIEINPGGIRMHYYERARQLTQETVAHRRYFHANAEVGLELPGTKAYVMDRLREAGIEPRDCGHGVTATVGRGGRCILLRADMDALPMPEESGEPFACTTGTEAHACGHDLHAAMLLTAAKLLKENEDNLKGTVKFMFQPAEETFEGAYDMVDHGILEDPRPDVAMTYHVSSGNMAPGGFSYNHSGTMMFSVDGFRITVIGRGAHGAYPHSAIDPINIAVHIYQAMQSILAREVDPQKACIMTVCTFHAGTANNIIPNEAEMTGTIRCNDQRNRELMKKRLTELTEQTAAAYGGSAKVTWVSQVPPLVCDPKLVDDIVRYMGELGIPGMEGREGVVSCASEDFAVLSSRMPASFMYLAAGFPEDTHPAPSHNPRVRYNEAVLPMGAACYAQCATRWLEENQ